ncbi:MAG: hypothetical protein FWG89_00210 [Treponema sp.]|nr:hypothetical protein [Treponema sp.]
MIIQIPGVDLEKVEDLYEDDTDLYVKVCRSYVSVTPAILDKLREVSAETLADYAVCIHSIKGTSTAIGAEETRIAALNLEKKAKAGDLSGVLAENQNFLKQAEKLIDDIRKWLEQYDASKK